MSAGWLLLLSALLHASWNALAKRDPDPRGVVFGISLAAAIYSGAAMPFFAGHAFQGRADLTWAVAAGLFEAGYLTTLSISLERAPLGVAYLVMRGGAMLVVWLISYLWLAEPLSGATLAGASLVLLGLALSSLRRVDGFAARDLGWAALCSLFIAGYHICYGRALGAGAHPIGLFALALWVALPLFAAASGRGFLAAFARQARARAAWLGFGGLVSGASFWIFLYALASSGAGLAITLRNTSVVFAQLLALALGEKVSRRQWTGAGLVAGGAALLLGG